MSGSCAHCLAAMLFLCASTSVAARAGVRQPGDEGFHYSVSIPHGVTTSRVYFRIVFGPGETRVFIPVPGTLTTGRWEVTVGFEPGGCGIYCIYRRKRETDGGLPSAAWLLPPITAIRIDSGSGYEPREVQLDPAGLGFPSADRLTPVQDSQACLSARRLHESAPLVHVPGQAIRPLRSTRLPARPDTATLSLIPLTLRI